LEEKRKVEKWKSRKVEKWSENIKERGKFKEKEFLYVLSGEGGGVRLA
jgi:hypothetical protein